MSEEAERVWEEQPASKATPIAPPTPISTAPVSPEKTAVLPAEPADVPQ